MTEFIQQNQHLSEEDIKQSIDVLVQEGTIYNTHDDDHFSRV